MSLSEANIARVNAYIKALRDKKEDYDKTKNENDGRKKFTGNFVNSDDFQIIFPNNSAGTGSEKEKLANNLAIMFSREGKNEEKTPFERIVEALDTFSKRSDAEDSQVDTKIETVSDAIILFDDASTEPFFGSTIDGINPQLEENLLTNETISNLKDNQLLRGKLSYKENSGSDNKNIYFHLAKTDGKVFLFFSEIHNHLEFENCDHIFKKLLPQITDTTVAELKFEKIETKAIQNNIREEEKKKIMALARKLKDNQDLSNDEKAQILMIKHVFISDDISGWTKSFNEKETENLLLYLAGDTNGDDLSEIKARLLFCKQEKINPITQIYGEINSFAYLFFQESQTSTFSGATAIKIGNDLIVKKDDKDDILARNKYILYNSGGHDVGFVFGPVKDNKCNVYIQDSIEATTKDKEKVYNDVIDKIWPEGERNGVTVYKIKTVKKKDNTRILFQGLKTDNQNKDNGIQSQCRYTAIIFSKQIIDLLSKSPETEFSQYQFEYDESTFVDKFAEWYDKEIQDNIVKQYSPLTVAGIKKIEIGEEKLSKIKEIFTTTVDQTICDNQGTEQDDKNGVEESKSPETNKDLASNQITFFHPEIKVDENLNDGDRKKVASFISNNSQKFDFSSTNDLLVNKVNKSNEKELKDKTQEIITKALNKALEQVKEQFTNFGEGKAAICILLAIKNGGVSNNKKAFQKDLENFLKTEGNSKISDEDLKPYLLFSKIFQQETAKSQIFTGNQNATKIVGMRLKRLTPDYAYQMLEKGLESELQNKKNEVREDFKTRLEKAGCNLDALLKETPSATVEYPIVELSHYNREIS